MKVDPAKRVHLVGIGGSGMSAIARLFLERGAAVTGSDERRTAIVEALEREGASVEIGHRAENVGDVDWVVASTAIDATNPERRAAHERAIPILSRGEMLAELIGSSPCIAVAGTHGKTTTTSMVASVLTQGGLDPSFAIGGIPVAIGVNARSGSGAWFVTEADESDGSFLHLRPTLAIVTNVENDHVADDRDMRRLEEQFERFLATVPAVGLAAIGIDNARSAALARRTRGRVRTFGLAENASLRAHGIRFSGLQSRFRVARDRVELGEIALNVPGAINVQNALGAIAVALETGIPFAAIAAGLEAFRGVRRRFEVLAQSESLTVVDDYAHHPTAVAETIAAARAFTRGPLTVAFQPHRYTRTAYLANEFARALEGADVVYLAPVYAAAEAPIAGVSERSIGEPLAARGVDVRYVASVDELPARIASEAPEGSVVLILGAGSITGAAHALAQRLTERHAVR